MPKQISYTRGVASLSKYIDHHHKMDAFDASLVLAYMFGVSKERALDDLIEYRSGKKINLAQKPVFKGLI
jgi:hypothetical protein